MSSASRTHSENVVPMLGDELNRGELGALLVPLELHCRHRVQRKPPSSALWYTVLVRYSYNHNAGETGDQADGRADFLACSGTRF